MMRRRKEKKQIHFYDTLSFYHAKMITSIHSTFKRLLKRKQHFTWTRFLVDKKCIFFLNKKKRENIKKRTKNYKPASCKWWWMISSWTTTIDLIIEIFFDFFLLSLLKVWVEPILSFTLKWPQLQDFLFYISFFYIIVLLCCSVIIFELFVNAFDFSQLR
jgi:hypothetical protein